MDAVSELLRIRQRLVEQLRSMQSEIEAIDRSVSLLKREHRGTTATGGGRSKSFAKLGITDAIRAAVTTEFSTPVEIRDRLLNGGISGKKKKTNLLNMVYATSARLAEKGEFEKGSVRGKQAYRKKEATMADKGGTEAP